MADERIVTSGPIEINPDTYSVAVDGKGVSVTLTEFRLLLAIVSAKGRALSRNQLIDRAIGEDAVVTDRTIDVHLTAIRRKLGKARKFIQTVRGVGLPSSGRERRVDAAPGAFGRLSG